MCFYSVDSFVYTENLLMLACFYLNPGRRSTVWSSWSRATLTGPPLTWWPWWTQSQGGPRRSYQSSTSCARSDKTLKSRPFTACFFIHRSWFEEKKSENDGLKCCPNPFTTCILFLHVQFWDVPNSAQTSLNPFVLQVLNARIRVFLNPVEKHSEMPNKSYFRQQFFLCPRGRVRISPNNDGIMSKVHPGKLLQVHRWRANWFLHFFQFSIKAVSKFN